VRAKYPEMKRIMLSAQVNEDFSKCRDLAHKYIAKPAILMYTKRI
jgi:hypothetical protein